MIVVLINITLHADYIDTFIELTRKNLLERELTIGGLWTEFYQDIKEPEKFTIIEAFDSQKSIDSYYKSNSYLAWHDETKDMIMEMKGSDQTLIHKT